MYYSAGPGGYAGGIPPATGVPSQPPPGAGIPAPAPAPPANMGIPAPAPAPMGGPPGGAGYSLPPAADELNLPSYGYDSKKVPDPPVVEKKIPKADDQDDNSDDEDLMARLRNLQK